jgi:hypothetical protein
VKEIARGRIGQVAGKYADSAPLAPACCNACRVCVTSNVVGIATAAVAAAGVGLARVAQRLRPRFARRSRVSPVTDERVALPVEAVPDAEGDARVASLPAS